MSRPRLRVRRVAGPPLVAIRVWLPGGARTERTPGQALITGRLLAEGSERRDWRRLAEDLEARGMAISAFGTYETHGIALDALAEDWELALEWAAELALTPAFAEDRCAWLVRQAIGELESLGDQPDVRTAWGFREQLYAPHRRALPVHGTAEGLAALTPAACRTFHRAAGAPIVAVAGDLDEAAVARRAEELFGRPGEAGGEGGDDVGGDGGDDSPASSVFGDPASDTPRRSVELPAADDGADGGGEPAAGGGQAHLYVGHLTIPRAHDDYEALELAAVVLGGGSGLSGRIPNRVREDEGLAYTARAQTVAGAGLDRGRLAAYVGTSAATVDRAELVVRQEIERFVAEGPDGDELVDARSYLLGREPFARETARQWAEAMAAAEHYGLPLDRPRWRRQRLAAPDRAAVAAAVRRHLRPDELRVTVGAPAAAPARR